MNMRTLCITILAAVAATAAMAETEPWKMFDRRLGTDEGQTPRNARFIGISAMSTTRMTSKSGRSTAKRLFPGGCRNGSGVLAVIEGKHC